MVTDPTPPFATVSNHFIADWRVALRSLCTADHYAALLKQSGLPASEDGAQGRVTLDQIVRLYQRAAVETGDEMMGLWSRPIRPRALQHLLTSVRESTSLASALYRFSTFWNLLLDDHQFQLTDTATTRALCLVRPYGLDRLSRLAQMLRIVDGTTEISRVVIGRALQKRAAGLPDLPVPMGFGEAGARDATLAAE